MNCYIKLQENIDYDSDLEPAGEFEEISKFSIFYEFIENSANPKALQLNYTVQR